MVKSSKKIYAALGIILSYIVIYGFLHGISTDIPNSYNAHENAIATSSKSDDSKPIIILDAGHGGVDGGCSAYNGALEKDINLSIELSLKAMLESLGYYVEVTRSSDISINTRTPLLFLFTRISLPTLNTAALKYSMQKQIH